MLIKNLPEDHPKPTKTESIPSEEVSLDLIEQEAREQLTLARSKERVMADDPAAIKQIYTELLAKYGHTSIAPTVRASIRHYDKLILSKPRLTLKKCQKDYHSTADKAFEHLMDKNYLNAQAEWKNFLDKYSETGLEWVQKAEGDLKCVIQLMDTHFGNISTEIKQLLSQKEFKQTGDLCQNNLPCFAGTQYEAQLQEKLQEAEISFQCYQLVLQAQALSQACRYTQALAQYQMFFSKLEETQITTLKKEDYQVQFQDLKKIASLFDKLLACINNKTITPRQLTLNDGRQARIEKATKDFLILSSVTLPWAEITPSQMVELYRHCPLQSDDLLDLARFCIQNNLLKEGTEVLSDFARSAPAKPQKAYPLIARLRHTEVPSGGFVFYKDQWLTPEEFKAITLVEKINSLVAKIEQSTDEKVLAETFSAFEKVYHNPATPDTTREQAQRQLVEILTKKREKVISEISHKRPRHTQLVKLKRDLNKRRKETLKVIFNTAIYPKNGPQKEKGQKIVDEKVARLRGIWNYKEVARGFDKSIVQRIEAIKKLDQYLTKLGIEPDEKFGDDLERILFMTGKRLDIRNFPLNAKEAGLMHYNKKIRGYNAKLLKTGPTSFNPSELKQISITNDYREMLGLKILRAHEALGRAARKHSQNMQAAGRLWHVGPDGNPQSRAVQEGYHGYGGENCAYGTESPQGVFDMWYHSPGHHRNMLRLEYVVLGVGQAGIFWTQHFGSVDDSKK